MRNTKVNQDGFGAIEGLLVVIAVTLIVGVGFLVVNSQNSDKKDVSNQTVTSNQAQTPVQPKSAAQPKMSDNELITQAVKSYKSSDGKQHQSNVTVTIDSITGDNARGSFFEEGVGGAMFVAQKTDGTWQVVSESQQ